jgi:hypothetical protein
MAVVNEAARPLQSGRAPEWARKYPPLVALIVGLVIALAILPSALNLPQSNPQETVEYAPVPPNDENQNNQNGNLSGLGLAGSASIGTEGAFGGDETPPAVTPPTVPRQEGVRCFGKNPPRQTEDPLSPPCVGGFNGDNFGATYQGVTRDRVDVLVFLEGSIDYINASDSTNRATPSNGACFDLSKPPEKGKAEHLTVKGLRTWQSYFNRRFQTYKRHVYFTVCYSTTKTPEGRRQDAVRNLGTLKPFASIVELSQGDEDDYLREMARKGVMNFGSFALRPQDYFQSYPKNIWSYLPSVEQQVDRYTSYICQKVVGKQSAIAGPALNLRTRKLGIITTTDQQQPGVRLMDALVKQKVEACGGKIEQEASFPKCCLGSDATENSSYADSEMATFANAGITTILWPGGINPQYGRAANNIGYQPEWILLGDSILDGNAFPSFRSNYTTNWDKHAIVVSPEPLMPGLPQQQCWTAFREENKAMADNDLRYVCEYYTQLFMLFTAIQVSGPRLGPTGIDDGFHAIPQRYNGTADTPACFYLPGDYTCIKDAQALYWDASLPAPGRTAQSAQNTNGCWRAIENGKRYEPGKWPAGNINAQWTGNEPCTGYSHTFIYAQP